MQATASQAHKANIYKSNFHQVQEHKGEERLLQTKELVI
jgi:hypothetical protein